MSIRRWIYLLGLAVAYTSTASAAVAEAQTVRIRLAVTDAGGTVRSHVGVGDAVELRVFVTDLRTASPGGIFGVFAAYMDITSDATRTSIAGPISYNNTAYPNVQRGNAAIPGLVDEVGAFDGFTGLGKAEIRMFTVPFVATAPGSVLFASDPGDDLPESYVLVFGSNDPVPTSEIVFGSTNLTITQDPLPSALDHFVFYKVMPPKDAAKFVKFGPVTLGDQFVTADYNVSKPKQLGLPADKNGEGVNDAATHLEEFPIKPVKGTPAFATRPDVQVANQCNEILLQVGKPVSVLVPSNKSSTGPVGPPDPQTSDVDHVLCHRAKAQAKRADGTKLPMFPKGIQVDVVDQFQARRYDLTRITKLCSPAAKTGNPLLLDGPNRGQAKPITPAVVRNPADHLLCYAAKLATKRIEQTGCGSTNPDDKGVKIVPKQAKHSRRTGLYVASQFGLDRLDTVKEFEFCIPSATQ